MKTQLTQASLLFTLMLGIPCQAFERIVSINLCTDQLLYLLEAPEHIASVSYLSQDPDYSYLASEMKAFPANNAQIEEIIQYNPDLILAGNYSDAHTLFFLRELGYRVESIAIPQDINHLEQGIQRLGVLLDKPAKADSIISDMRQRKQIAQEKVLHKNRPLAVILAPDGYTHGKHSMNGDLLELAGYRNLAAETGVEGSGNITLEDLIQAQPDILIIEDAAANHNSLSQRLLQHPALTRGLKQMQQVFVHPNLWTCGGPSMIKALEILVESHP